MKTTKTKGLLSLGLLLGIFLISVINAQTLIAGKVYDSGYNNFVSGAGVTVTCNSHSLDTHSLDDGTYAVRFEENICDLGSSVEVNSGKGSLSGFGTGIVVECDDTSDCDSGLFSIVNLAIKSQSNNNNNAGSGNHRYYLCGNGVCNSGENVNTCPKDCKPVIQNQTTQTTNTETSNEETQTLNPINPKTTNSSQGAFLRITGAVTGALGNAGWLIIIIFILGIIGLSISVRIIRKRNAINKIQ